MLRHATGTAEALSELIRQSALVPATYNNSFHTIDFRDWMYFHSHEQGAITIKQSALYGLADKCPMLKKLCIVDMSQTNPEIK